MTASGLEVSFGGSKGFWDWTLVMVEQLCECTKTH